MTASDVASATPQAQDGKSCPNSKEASPVKVKTPAEVQEEATTCLVTGKRHLLVSDIPAAVTILAKACELLSTQFGETAKECAESYFYYGKALLELSRIESGVLGNALDGVPEEDDEANNSKIEDPEKMTEEEKNEVEEKVTEALEENLESLQKKEETKGDEKEVPKEGAEKDDGKVEKEEKMDVKEKTEVEGKGEKEAESKAVEESSEKLSSTETKESVATETKDSEATESKESEVTESKETEVSESKESEATEEESMDEGEDDSETTEDGKPETEKKEGDDEEPSNLQLAWEMLELAKVVYTKQIETVEGDKTQLEERLCSSILALGEVSLENENYSQAVEDIKLCLEKQKNLPKDSRLVAESHYQLGVAQGFNAQYDEAVESLNSAITIIKEKIKNLNETHKTPSDDIKKEISELEALVPEIEEKIADTKDMKKEAESKPKEGEEGFSADTKDAKMTKSVSTIAVKRKAEDDGTDSKVKKVAADGEKETEKTAAAV